MVLFRMIVKAIRARKTPKVFLTEWREKNNFSQAELAKLVGVRRETVTRWENETRPISLDVLVVLAKALRIHPAMLLLPPRRYSADVLLELLPVREARKIRQNMLRLARRYRIPLTRL
jgi:transcriptional regulator with XRE-family HTH domain